MKRQLLGLDINDEYLAAAVVGLSGQNRIVTGCAHARFTDRDAIAEILPSLLQQVNWKGGACICGISLADISLRNLAVPFTEKRKIEQILPLELEDQLIRPVEEQIIDYIITRTDGDQSHLLIAGREKTRLQYDLGLLRNAGLNPDGITLRSIALAERYSQLPDLSDGFLLIDTGTHTATMVIVQSGRVAFVRRLAYSEGVFTSAPFILDEEGPRVIDHTETMKCIGFLCDDIKRSIGLYQFESGIDSLPEDIVLAGCMAKLPEFKEKVAGEFGRKVVAGNLQSQLNVPLALGVQDAWQPEFGEHALALALQGAQKKIPLNFRRDEFAPAQLLFASRRNIAVISAVTLLILAGIFAYLGYDYQQLKSRYDALGERMEDLFRETFPETTRIVDPLVQMQANLRDVQAPSIATPIFSDEKRVLNILADISERVPVNIKIHVTRMVVDKDSVAIKGTTDTFNNVNLIQEVLRRSPLYGDVDIVSAASDKDSGMIRFEMKLRTVERSL